MVQEPSCLTSNTRNFNAGVPRTTFQEKLIKTSGREKSEFKVTLGLEALSFAV